MPIYTFKCRYGHVFDKLVPLGTEAAQCPATPKWADVHCDAVAKRQPTAANFAIHGYNASNGYSSKDTKD